jgi:hypothetical protein
MANQVVGLGMKLRFLFIFVVTLLVGVALAGFCATRSRMSSRVIDQWETTNGNIDIRVKAFAEDGWGPVPGAYYVFESARHDSNNWQAIMTFRHDDPVPVPRDQIRFVNDRTAFVFMGWMYSVTTDGGANWSVWSAQEHIPEYNYALIESVQLESSGYGVMRLDTSRSNNIPDLLTRDYGRHWCCAR